ncbi:MAG: hypothetical protein U1C49_00815 [Candidatus Andersenbacteria bacterium]|nr:hypothetical protein [Candidatus Andersenbacteria bacterium]
MLRGKSSKRVVFWQVILPWLLFFVVIGAGFAGARGVGASALGDEIRARAEERRAEMEADRAQRDQERAEAKVQREAELAAKAAAREAERQQRESGCSFSTSLSLAKPKFIWHNSTLRIVPTVDINIRSRGNEGAPGFTAVLDYAGSSSYESKDVSVPAGVTFSGQKTVFSGSCGSSFKFSGYQLPAVDLSGVTTSLVGVDQSLNGTVHLQATLSGVGTDTEQKKADFTLKDLVNIRTGGWRIDR